jgi:hypothetical protein
MMEGYVLFKMYNMLWHYHFLNIAHENLHILKLSKQILSTLYFKTDRYVNNLILW